MRLFFAIQIPVSLIACLSEAQNRLRTKIGSEGIRWTKPEQFHYTLKFLGDQPPQRFQTIVDCGFAVKEGVEPFEITMSGIGAFPSERRPSVLWIGAESGAGQITDLAKHLDEELHRHGFPRETKSHDAHLTVARIKSYASEIAAARALKSPVFEDLGAFTVDRFVLMRSYLKPSGSDYAVVEEYLLKPYSES